MNNISSFMGKCTEKVEVVINIMRLAILPGS